MRASIVLLAISVWAIGCTPSNPQKIKVTTPDFRVPTPRNFDFDFSKTNPDLIVCDNPPKNIDDEQKKNAVQIKGQTDFQDTEWVDCEGKKTLRPKAALRNFRHELAIAPAVSATEPVEELVISNARTCVTRSLKVTQQEDGLAKEPLDILSWYRLSPDGSGAILLNEMTTKLISSGLNSAGGYNEIEIIYFGKCLENDNKAEGKCVKRQELERHSILLSIELEKRELNGVRTLNICPKKANTPKP